MNPVILVSSKMREPDAIFREQQKRDYPGENLEQIWRQILSNYLARITFCK